MPIGPDHRIVAGFVVAVLIMTGIGTLAYRSTVQAASDVAWVVHTKVVLNRLALLLSLITDAETGQRGYALTGNETYLEPYRKSLTELAEVYASLRELTADNAQQQAQLDALRPVLDARLATLSASVDIRRAQGLVAAIAREASTGTGKQLHDRIRVIVKAMEETERILLHQREEQSADAKRATQAIIFAGNLMAIALIALSLRHALRELARRRAVEAALQASNAELTSATARAQQSDHLKSAFLATMSHELRTPLNSIIGFSGILRQELAGPLNAEQVKQLDMVQNSARHLLALINDVLDISKIEAGEMDVSCASFDLRAVIESAVASITPQAAKKGLALSTYIEPELAPLLSELVSDRRRVQQVLINLLNNAVKFTESGTVAVDAVMVRGGRQLRLQVRDSGKGIKPENLDVLFRPFRQVETGLARQHEGTGLGLAICQRLASLLGGSIEVESRWGQGSTFSFILPLAREEQS